MKDAFNFLMLLVGYALFIGFVWAIFYLAREVMK